MAHTSFPLVSWFGSTLIQIAALRKSGSLRRWGLIVSTHRRSAHRDEPMGARLEATHFSIKQRWTSLLPRITMTPIVHAAHFNDSYLCPKYSSTRSTTRGVKI